MRHASITFEEAPLDPDLPTRHMAAMRQAANNLLRQLASEGVRYHLAATGGTATTLHLSVDALTPDIRLRIERCLRGIGATVSIVDAGAAQAAANGPARGRGSKPGAGSAIRPT